jgi:hypothetical protein
MAQPVPTDYAEMFEQNWDYIRKLVRKAGIYDEDVDDVASDIIVRFMEPRPCKAHGHKNKTPGIRKSCKDCSPGGFLDLFKAEKRYEIMPDGSTREMAKGETAKVVKAPRFNGFLTKFVLRYVMQYRDKQHTRTRKEVVHMEQPVGSEETPLTWAEVFAPTDSDETEQWTELADYELAVTRAQLALDEQPVRGKRDLAKVFRMVTAQVEETGVVNRKEIAVEFGVSDTAICQMFADLRKFLIQNDLFSHA